MGKKMGITKENVEIEGARKQFQKTNRKETTMRRKRNKNREIVHKKRLVHNISKPRALFFNKEGQLFNKRDEGDIIIDVGFVKGYKSGVQR